MSTTAEIMAMVDMHAETKRLEHVFTDKTLVPAQRTVLLETVETLVLDAARYRWLRDANNFEFGWWSMNAAVLNLDDLDAAIDEAMRKMKEAK